MKKKVKIDALTDDTDSPPEADQSKNKKSKSFFSRFRLNQHRSMERRIRLFAIGLSIFIVGVGISLYHNHVAQIAAMNVATPVDTQVQFSKTQVNMTLKRPYLSQDRTTAYIPISFDDMSNLSTDSNDYHVFVQESAGGTLNYKPSGRLILFGSSGHGVIVLQAPTGITNQMLAVFIRNDKNLNDPDGIAAPVVSSDQAGVAAAQEKYDLLYFTVNPGASNATRSSYLDGSAVTVNVLYRELFANQNVRDVKKEIRKDRNHLTVLLNQAQEAKRRLTQMGWKVPKDPKWLASDWMPSNRAPVKLDGNLRDGLITGMLPPSDEEDGSNLAPDDPANTTFPGYLVNQDGVHSDSVSAQTAGTSDESAFDPQETWSELQSDWTQIGQVKEDLYVTQGTALYHIESDVNNQTRVASISKPSKFTPIGKIEVPSE